MRQSRRIALFLMLCTMAFAASAQPNGCGSGWNTALVPDKIRILQCTMQTACDAHDTCYGQCEKRTDGECAYRRCRADGDLAGKPECRINPLFIKSESDAMVRRAACDVKLASAIIESNPGRWACKAVAIIYREAVRRWGNPSFSGFAKWDKPAAWRQTQAEYETAIASFIEKSTDEDFKTFVQSFESEKPQVDFCGRLQYSDEGLTNIVPEEIKPCSPLLKTGSE